MWHRPEALRTKLPGWVGIGDSTPAHEGKRRQHPQDRGRGGAHSLAALLESTSDVVAKEQGSGEGAEILMQLLQRSDLAVALNY